MDLVGDHPDAVAGGEVGHGLQLIVGVDRACRVVRTAEDVGLRAVRERPLEPVQIEASVGAQRHLQRAPAGVGEDLEEPGVGRRVERYRCARLGHDAQQLGEAAQDAHGLARASGLQVMPAPAIAGERRPGVGQDDRGRVAGVADVEELVNAGADDRRKGRVHLGHPERQHVGRVRRPLHARALLQIPQLIGGKRVGSSGGGHDRQARPECSASGCGFFLVGAPSWQDLARGQS